MTKNKKAQHVAMTTPEATAVYTHLSEPDIKFEKPGWYKITFSLPDKDAKAFEKTLNGELQAHLKALKVNGDTPTKVNPVEGKRITAPDGKEQILFTAKLRPYFTSNKDDSKIYQRPQVFDGMAKPMGELIGSGSKVKVAMHLIRYNTAMATGVTLRLKAVQCLNLVRVGGNEAEDHGFGVIEGGFESTTKDEPISTTVTISSTPNEIDPSSASDF
jgi:hypothetical protein